MNYGTIKNYDIANGTGVRVSLFVSGCGITAKDASIPKPGISITEIHTPKKLKQRSSKHSNRHTFRVFSSWREPFEPENQKELAGLLQKIKESYPEKNVWCYTGYLYDIDLIPGGKVYTEYTDKMLACIDTS